MSSRQIQLRVISLRQVAENFGYYVSINTGGSFSFETDICAGKTKEPTWNAESATFSLQTSVPLITISICTRDSEGNKSMIDKLDLSLASIDIPQSENIFWKSAEKGTEIQLGICEAPKKLKKATPKSTGRRGFSSKKRSLESQMSLINRGGSKSPFKNSSPSFHTRGDKNSEKSPPVSNLKRRSFGNSSPAILRIIGEDLYTTDDDSDSNPSTSNLPDPNQLSNSTTDLPTTTQDGTGTSSGTSHVAPTPKTRMICPPPMPPSYILEKLYKNTMKQISIRSRDTDDAPPEVKWKLVYEQAFFNRNGRLTPQDPAYWVDGLKHCPAEEFIREMTECIKDQSIEWIDQLYQKDVLSIISTLVMELLEHKKLEKDAVQFILAVVECFEVLLYDQQSFMKGMSNPIGPQMLLCCLLRNELMVDAKIIILKFLIFGTLIPLCYQIILLGLAEFQRQQEQPRFVLLLQLLVDSKSLKFQELLVTLINFLVNAPNSLEMRLEIRAEVEKADFDRCVRIVLDSASSPHHDKNNLSGNASPPISPHASTLLLTQLEIYKRAHFNDQKLFQTRFSFVGDINPQNPNDLFLAIDRISHKHQLQNYVKEIFDDLLAMYTNDSAIAKSKWAFANQILQNIFSDRESDEMVELLSTVSFKDSFLKAVKENQELVLRDRLYTKLLHSNQKTAESFQTIVLDAIVLPKKEETDAAALNDESNSDTRDTVDTTTETNETSEASAEGDDGDGDGGDGDEEKSSNTKKHSILDEVDSLLSSLEDDSFKIKIKNSLLKTEKKTRRRFCEEELE
eukprot:TRINITY_DN576_c1_g1_i4.p1 TRINITY_DN576_c1_g1~~TRINITY_DN576_c1_g1_i4.p1  ORF type:complete len:794 (+),score=212.42 TRINITY_DN576_c1_g1_i4:46-2427(+)